MSKKSPSSILIQSCRGGSSEQLACPVTVDDSTGQSLDDLIRNFDLRFLKIFRFLGVTLSTIIFRDPYFHDADYYTRCTFESRPTLCLILENLGGNLFGRILIQYFPREKLYASPVSLSTHGQIPW